MWPSSHLPRKADLTMPFPAAPFLSAVSFSSALFLSLLALPRLGVFVAMFAGVPIIMAQLRYPAVLLGTGAMVTSGGVIFLFASLLKTTMPGLAVLLYIGLCGLPALVVASLIRRGSPPLMIILSGAFQIVFFLGGIAFLLYEKTSGELWTALSKSLHQAVLIVMNTAIQNAQTTLTPDEKTRLMALEPMIFRTVVSIIPGMLASYGLLTAMALWGVPAALRKEETPTLSEKGPEDFLLPDPVIFLLIASLALFLVPTLSVRIIGTNLVMVLGALYAGQGVAILVHYVKKRKIGRWFWGVAALFVALQPLFFLLFSIIGVLDIWVDFRNLRGAAGGGRSSGKTVDQGGNSKDVSTPTNDSHCDALPASLVRIGDWKTHLLGELGRRFRNDFPIWLTGYVHHVRNPGNDRGGAGLMVRTDLLWEKDSQWSHFS